MSMNPVISVLVKVDDQTTKKLIGLYHSLQSEGYSIPDDLKEDLAARGFREQVQYGEAIDLTSEGLLAVRCIPMDDAGRVKVSDLPVNTEYITIDWI